jgi:quercetin dioxygenase-like cupin family protein
MDSLPVLQGARIRNAFNGETFIFTQLGEDADVAEFDVHLEAGGMLTGTGRQHVHPRADEEFTVVDGKLTVVLNGLPQTLRPGQSLNVVRGTPHYFRNGHDGETLVTVRFRPGQQFLRFFLNMSLGTANHPEWYDETGEPSLVLRALALHAYAGHGYAAGIPIWVQRALFAVLSPVARLKGYRLSVPPRRELAAGGAATAAWARDIG